MRNRLRKTGFLALLLSMAAGAAAPAQAQVNIEAYRDYFLVGQFGEVCTMCEIIVLCENSDAPPAHESVPAGGTFALYHLETRTFFSQIATIWEWFIANFTADRLAARGHTRPVNVFAINDGRWSGPRQIEGRLVLDPGVVEFAETRIDRVTRQWLESESGEPIGYCQRLPLWESLEAIARNTGDGS